ncbi:helix-turn-helix domain-containing protein [Verrucomicrobium spinosum]|nr:helix-turn-helix transcriptional regulator [Verrucomicrobium spinosum]
MEPDQLRHLRESRGMTREALAEWLGDCSASTVNKWERGMHAIPGWVEQKMLSDLHLNLPLKAIHALMNHAQSTGQDFASTLALAIQQYLGTEEKTKETGTTYNKPASKITEFPLAAEERTHYKAPRQKPTAS